MTQLKYRAFGTSPDDLALNECTIRDAVDATRQTRWWQLWFVGFRRDNGQLELLAAPVNPNGPYLEQDSTRRRTWGLNRCGPNEWQISPSINFGNDVWHETPKLVGVPEGEPWM